AGPRARRGRRASGSGAVGASRRARVGSERPLARRTGRPGAGGGRAGALIQAPLTAFGGKLRYPSPTSGRRTALLLLPLAGEGYAALLHQAPGRSWMRAPPSPLSPSSPPSPLARGNGAIPGSRPA